MWFTIWHKSVYLCYICAMKFLSRLLILFCNYVPFLLVCAIGFAIWKFHSNLALMLGIILGIIYIIPPVLCRLILVLFPLKDKEYELLSKEYYVWWFTFCCQIIYLRLPVLEEVLRLIPGVYSLWLRVFWGAKIGRFTFWAPRTRILDRSFINIGNNVVFAADTRINPHVQTSEKLLLAPVVIEDNVVVGAYSLLTSGTVLKSNQNTKAFLISPPFSVWKDGVREYKGI